MRESECMVWLKRINSTFDQLTVVSMCTVRIIPIQSTLALSLNSLFLSLNIHFEHKNLSIRSGTIFNFRTFTSKRPPNVWTLYFLYKFIWIPVKYAGKPMPTWQCLDYFIPLVLQPPTSPGQCKIMRLFCPVNTMCLYHKSIIPVVEHLCKSCPVVSWHDKVQCIRPMPHTHLLLWKVVFVFPGSFDHHSNEREEEEEEVDKRDARWIPIPLFMLGNYRNKYIAYWHEWTRTWHAS